MKKKRLTRLDRFQRAIARIIWFLVDPELIWNKLAAIALIALTIPLIVLENDATATVFISMFAIPMFFSKQRWIF